MGSAVSAAPRGCSASHATARPTPALAMTSSVFARGQTTSAARRYARCSVTPSLPVASRSHWRSGSAPSSAPRGSNSLGSSGMRSNAGRLPSRPIQPSSQ